MQDAKEKVNAILRQVRNSEITIKEAECKVSEILDFAFYQAKERVIDTFRDLPTECVNDCNDTKFCESRLYNRNRCKECFSNND